MPKIETANMDGSSRRILVKRALYWPSGLTLDEANNRLYWVDSYLQIFEYYDFKRHTVTTVIKDGYKLPYPFGLTLLESHLYWTDWSSRVVYRAEQKTLSNRTVVVSGLGQPMDIHAYDRSKLLPGKLTPSTLALLFFRSSPESSPLRTSQYNVHRTVYIGR